MDHAALISDLGTFLRPDQLLTSDEDCSVYAFDGTALLHQRPACVALPESREEMSPSSWPCAISAEVPVVPRGSGTGLAGGSVPSQGGVALCLVRLNQILELDAANLVMVVQPGVLTQQIADAAQAAGLFYPPDPGSIKISTIGGNVANNSGGLRGLKYGVTRDYVMGLEVVLADGQVLETGNKCVKDVAGFTLKDLFIGSEGMLGVITKITLKLVPAPASKKTLLGLYDEMTQAAATVSAIIAQKIIPCTLEFLDRTTIECVEAHANIGLPTDCEAVLLMEVDGHPAQVAEQAAQIEAIAREGGARSVRLADSEEEAQQLAAARRTAFSALARLAPTVVLEGRHRAAQRASSHGRLRAGSRPTAPSAGGDLRPLRRREPAPHLPVRRARRRGNGPRRKGHGRGFCPRRGIGRDHHGRARSRLGQKALLARATRAGGARNSQAGQDRLRPQGHPKPREHVRLSDDGLNLLRDLDYSVLQQCMHCGMCLPTCPTYDATLNERSSPRGRIAMMRAIADGKLEASKTFAEEMYFCLGCLACQTACPAGVDYAALFENARAEVERQGLLDGAVRNFVRRWVLGWLFAKQTRLRAVARLMRAFQRSGLQTLARRSGLLRLLPFGLGNLEPLAPQISPRFTDQLYRREFAAVQSAHTALPSRAIGRLRPRHILCRGKRRYNMRLTAQRLPSTAAGSPSVLRLAARAQRRSRTGAVSRRDSTSTPLTLKT